MSHIKRNYELDNMNARQLKEAYKALRRQYFRAVKNDRFIARVYQTVTLLMLCYLVLIT